MPIHGILFFSEVKVFVSLEVLLVLFHEPEDFTEAYINLKVVFYHIVDLIFNNYV